MASIFRPTYRDKKTGRTRKLRRWYVKYKDADGIVRRVKGHTDREATKQLAARLERDAARRQEGMIDPCVESHRKPLAEHLDDYRRCLLAKGDTEKHAGQTRPLRRGRPRRLPFRFHPRPVSVRRRGVPARPAPGRGRPRTAAGTGSVHQGGAGASPGRESRQRGDDAPPGRPDGDGERQGPTLPAGDRRGPAGWPPPQRRPLNQQRLSDRREGVHALAGPRPPHGR